MNPGTVVHRDAEKTDFADMVHIEIGLEIGHHEVTEIDHIVKGVFHRSEGGEHRLAAGPRGVNLRRGAFGGRPADLIRKKIVGAVHRETAHLDKFDFVCGEGNQLVQNVSEVLHQNRLPEKAHLHRKGNLIPAAGKLPLIINGGGHENKVSAGAAAHQLDHQLKAVGFRVLHIQKENVIGRRAGQHRVGTAERIDIVAFLCRPPPVDLPAEQTFRLMTIRDIIFHDGNMHDNSPAWKCSVSSISMSKLPIIMSWLPACGRHRGYRTETEKCVTRKAAAPTCSSRIAGMPIRNFHFRVL